MFGGVVDSLKQSVSGCHLLRVLDLEDCDLKDLSNVKFVGNLLHLRFLSLANTGYAGELPVDIGRLQFLQTLDLRGTEIEELPSSIVSLRQLMFLYVDESTRLPNGLRCLQSLEQLSWARVDSADVAEELGHMKQLTRLAVNLKIDKEDRLTKSLCTALVVSICNLHKIEILVVDTGGVAADLDGSPAMVPSMFPQGAMPRLEAFEFNIQLEDFSQGEFTVDDLALGHLPSLKRVVAVLHGRRKVSGEVARKVEEKLRREADVHPNNPSILVT
jgi:disease resistance protein RPM1